MDKLTQARNTINEVDRRMAELFCRRMEAVKEIAAYKQERGLPVFDKAREADVIENNAKLVESEELRAYYVIFLKNTIELSKQLQQRLVEGIHVAYSGVEGAFADIAAKRIFPDGRHSGCEDFRAAYTAVEDGKCDVAVLPIENSYAGVVGQVMDLMFEGGLYVNGVYTLPITQNLLGVEGASTETVRRVMSHPQALSQCSRYIKKHGYETVSAVNTAVAAQEVARLGDVSTAAIASVETASLYGLKVLDRGINASAVNTTKFAVFSRVESRNSGRNSKFILMFTVNDVPGALAKAINVIGEHGFNMKVLRSRPAKEHAWQYYFYVEAEGDETSEQGRQMLTELAIQCEKLKIVGHYADEISLKEQ